MFTDNRLLAGVIGLAMTTLLLAIGSIVVAPLEPTHSPRALERAMFGAPTPR